MSKRAVTILIILWTLMGALAMVWYFAPAAQQTDGITRDESYVVTEKNVYVSTNVDQHGVIYKLTPGGALDDSFLARRNSLLKKVTFDKLAYKDDLFLLCSGSFINSDITMSGYKIIRFSDELIPARASGWFKLDTGLTATGFTADEDRLYITAVSSDRTQLAVYEVKFDDLVDINNAKESDNKSKKDKSKDSEEEYITLTPVQTDVADTGRKYADACYEPGKLHVRYDNEKLSQDEFFVTDRSADAAYDNFKVPSKLINQERGIYPGLIILIWVIGIPAIILLCVIFHHRGHFVYAALILTFIIALIIVTGTYATFLTRATICEDQYSSFASYVTGSVFEKIDLSAAAESMGIKDRISEDTTEAQIEAKQKAFYDSSYCREMLKDMETKIRLSDEGEGIKEFLLIKRSTGEIILSSDNDNRDSVERKLGRTAAELAMTNSSGSHIRVSEYGKGSSREIYLARSLDEDGLYGCSLIAVCDYGQDVLDIAKKNKKAIDSAIRVFIITSLLIILILYLQSRDVHLIAQMLKAMAEGKTDIKKPNVRGDDLIAMKNSVYEIEKNIKNVNRAKFMTFEAYYRFAPKSIEKILGRNSIVEVDVGDDTRLMGTVAVVATKGNVVTFPERTNRLFEIFEESRKEHNGIYITCNETLSSSRFLFTEKYRGAVPFGVEVLNGARELSNREYTNTLVLLHYTRFSYGVVGTKEQSVAYLGSSELETLVGYTDWLRSLRLSFVVTGAVVEHEHCGDTRYIGFIIAGDRVRIDLYEVLSGSSARVKEAKKKLAASFEEALKLFYAQDFFLARNAFTDILRDFPEDELVKWYLFECESRLNGDIDTGFTGALHV